MPSGDFTDVLHQKVDRLETELAEIRAQNAILGANLDHERRLRVIAEGKSRVESLRTANEELAAEVTRLADLQVQLDSANILVAQLKHQIKEISEIHGGPQMANCITVNRREAREWALTQVREWLQKSTLTMTEAFDDAFATGKPS